MKEAITIADVIQKHAPFILSAAFSHPICKTGIPENTELPVPLPAGCLRIRVRPAASAYAAMEQRRNGSSCAFMLEAFTARQAFHRTVSAEELANLAAYCAGHIFRNISVRYESAEGICTVSAQANRRGKLAVFQHTEQNTPAPRSTLQKGIPEGIPVPFLIRLGVTTPEGKLITSRRSKFRQINRFLEYIDDILEPLQKDKNGAPLRIIDFGCGKSYLTFAVYYYLNELKHIPVEITGIDLKEDVVADCAHLAQLSGYTGLHFTVGSIESFREQAQQDNFPPPDLVMSLHACDTATDCALAFAVEHTARAILSVPCCQHEVNSMLHTSVPAFAPLVKYGLLKERFSALATDALRAELLSASGYSVQILEFIDMSHTPKNILIRALFTGKKETQARQNAQELTAALGCTPALCRLLPS